MSSAKHDRVGATDFSERVQLSIEIIDEYSTPDRSQSASGH